MFHSLELLELERRIKFSEKSDQLVLLESRTLIGEDATKHWQRFAPPFIVALPPSEETLKDPVFNESYSRFKKHASKTFAQLKGEFE